MGTSVQAANMRLAGIQVPNEKPSILRTPGEEQARVDAATQPNILPMPKNFGDLTRAFPNQGDFMNAGLSGGMVMPQGGLFPAEGPATGTGGLADQGKPATGGAWTRDQMLAYRTQRHIAAGVQLEPEAWSYYEKQKQKIRDAGGEVPNYYADQEKGIVDPRYYKAASDSIPDKVGVGPVYGGPKTGQAGGISAAKAAEGITQVFVTNWPEMLGGRGTHIVDAQMMGRVNRAGSIDEVGANAGDAAAMRTRASLNEERDRMLSTGINPDTAQSNKGYDYRGFQPSTASTQSQVVVSTDPSKYSSPYRAGDGVTSAMTPLRMEPSQAWVNPTTPTKEGVFNTDKMGASLGPLEEKLGAIQKALETKTVEEGILKAVQDVKTALENSKQEEKAKEVTPPVNPTVPETKPAGTEVPAVPPATSPYATPSEGNFRQLENQSTEKGSTLETAINSLVEALNAAGGNIGSAVAEKLQGIKVELAPGAQVTAVLAEGSVGAIANQVKESGFLTQEEFKNTVTEKVKEALDAVKGAAGVAASAENAASPELTKQLQSIVDRAQETLAKLEDQAKLQEKDTSGLKTSVDTAVQKATDAERIAKDALEAANQAKSSAGQQQVPSAVPRTPNSEFGD
jgi:hypothetical protein